jgi:electron transport complex protein RnfD
LSVTAPQLQIATSPFVHRGLSTPRLMWEVLGSLVLVVASATWFFGLAAILLVAAASLGTLCAEWLLLTDRRGLGCLRDGSALLTGVLLALTLPPATPLWMAFLGGAVGIGLGKAIWGGLGQNLFNPALVGRAFLQAAFPAVLTTWTAPRAGLAAMQPSTLAAPLMHVDVTTTATPLGLAKFENQITELLPLLLGNRAGSLGETAGLVIILCGIWLAARRAFDWRLLASSLLSVFLLTGLLYLVGAEGTPPPLFMICSGSLLFGAVFMVTDPVTTPITPRGAWIYGGGFGVLVVLIRLYGGLPEGVMYAILLMNAATPLINRYTQPRQFGS